MNVCSKTKVFLNDFFFEFGKAKLMKNIRYGIILYVKLCLALIFFLRGSILLVFGALEKMPVRHFLFLSPGILLFTGVSALFAA